jgi:hypothetical protein
MNTMRTCVLVTGLIVACASAASAQPTTASTTAPGGLPLDDKVFVSINVGSQMRSTTTNNDFSFPLYRETATVTTTTSVGGGPLLDVSVGYRFRPQIGVAIGFSSFGDTGTVAGAGSIPNPTFFNRPASVTIPEAEAKRSERSTYVMLIGSMPVAEKTDVSVFIGPSFTRVTQDFIGNASVPAGTQNVVTGMANESGTVKSVIVGADVAYQFMPMVGIGLFLRYNGGSVDLPTLKDVKAGGFQAGIGARLRF